MPPEEPSDKDIPFWLRDTDPQGVLYREIGYLPPLSPEVSALVEAIRADPDMTPINPGNEDFERGLTQRNILLKVSRDSDPAISRISNLKSTLDHEIADQL